MGAGGLQNPWGDHKISEEYFGGGHLLTSSVLKFLQDFYSQFGPKHLAIKWLIELIGTQSMEPAPHPLHDTLQL